MSAESNCLLHNSKLVHRRIRLFVCSISLIAVAFIANQKCSADIFIYSEECGGKDAIEYEHGRMLEPCESDKLLIEQEKRVGSPCIAEFEACRDDRMSKLGESSDKAEDFCMYRPTSLDPNFKGACPAHLEELESPKYDADKWLLDRTHTRLGFTQFTEEGERIFRQQNSARRLRKLLESEPNNLVALISLSVLYDENGVVESIKLENRRYELEPDCRKNWFWLPRVMHSHFEELTRNWLDGKGTGSELNEAEIRDVFRRTRALMIDMYDNAIDKSYGKSKLNYALDSLNESLLTGKYSSIKKIADRVGIDMDGYAENRRTTLMRQLAQEYGVESTYGPKKTLGMMCNDSAFEMGFEEHCLDLLDHYSTRIPLYDESLGRHWALAATLLVNRLTSDCSKVLDPIADFNRCIVDRHPEFTTRIRTMLSNIPRQPSNAERELLVAYLNMDETSDEYFIRSIALDGSMVEYAEILSRRLHKRGKSDAAFNILKASIEALNQSERDEDQPEVTDDRESQTENRSQVRLLRLESVLKSVNDGQYHNCNESYKYAPWMEDALSETSEDL